jgi:eukaryotic-like serine/threonine-protein kinase
MIGKQLGEWIIDESLAVGLVSQLWRVHHHDRTNEVKVIKLITRTGQDPRFQTNWLASASVWRRIRHPNLVVIHDHGIYEGQPYMVRDWIEGEDYQTRLQEGKRPSWQEVLQIARQLMACLRHLHRRGMLHGELRPSHIIRTPDGDLRLIDPGIFALFPEFISEPPPQVASIFSYLAPELLMGKKASKRSDFYSLGLVLYALMVGRPPFVGALPDVIRKQCYVLPERPSHFISGLPTEIDQILMRLLMKDPSVRPNSGTLLQAEFERIWGELESRGILPERPDVVDLDPPAPEVAAIIDERDDPVESLFDVESPPKSYFWLKAFGLIIGLTLVLSVLILTFWPNQKTAEQCLAEAKTLLESDEPNDWQLAWDDYLGPMQRSHPNECVRERETLRRKLDAWHAQNRAFATAQLIKYDGEAARWYREALDSLEASDYDEAERRWLDLILLFEEIPAAKDWVILARQGLDRLNRQSLPRAEARKLQGERIRECLPHFESRIQEMITQKRFNDIFSLLRLLQNRYPSDPVISEWMFRQRESLPKEMLPPKD